MPAEITSTDDDPIDDNQAGDSARGQSAFVRRKSEVTARDWTERFRSKVRRVCRTICCMGTADPTKRNEDVEKGAKRQYRLESSAKNRGRRGFLNIISCGLLGKKGRSSSMTVGINPNQQLAMSLHWMFRVNFMFLFFVMCVMFFVLVIFFAALIIIAGKLEEECVRIGGQPFGEVDSEFADAFALSWTTFSTVGYGSTYPALGNENSSPTNCFFITFICSLESLLGVLYSGFCGAILFGKVLRIQSHAQVIFSDPIVIRYGSGVAETGENGNDSDDDGDNAGSGAKRPCPVLEFRIVNRLFNEAGGEIMDATLNVVANVDANDADPSLIDALESSEPSRNYFNRSNPSHQESQSVSDRASDNGGHFNNASQAKSFPKFLDSIRMKSERPSTEEDPTARLVSKRIFSKMLIEASDHPFFKRVWLARHVLDETSPILKPRVRRQIRRNGGSWPERLSSWSAIRESLQFNQILVSLNGVSNVSASDVYAQKIYDFVDINVGYQFVNILYKDTDGTLKVDTDLINDVREQKGGGGEPLIIDE